MSINVDGKPQSKTKINLKGKISKSKQKNNLNSLTPNKQPKAKDDISYNNKINNNNSNVMNSNNNNYNINNNISININIDMTNNRQRQLGATKNKSHMKNQPIRIKKDEYKNSNSLIFNTLKNYTNKNNSKKSPFHIRIKSANMGSKDFKFNNNKANNNLNMKNNNTINPKKNFNLTTTQFNPKKESNNINKTTIEAKNVSLENISRYDANNNNINNDAKKSLEISIQAGRLNNDKNLFKYKSNKPYKTTKNPTKKRNNFSPSINRELLNRKQNTILNYSIGNNKKNINANNKTIINENNKNNTLQPKINSFSPFARNKKITYKNKNNLNFKENTINIANLLRKNQNLNNSKTHILNYIAKSPLNNNKFEANNFKYTVKNYKNNNKKEYYLKSPNIGHKNLNKENKSKNSLGRPEPDDSKKRNSHSIRIPVKKEININVDIKGKDNKNQENKKKEEKNKQEEQKEKGNLEEKKNQKEEEKKKANDQKEKIKQVQKKDKENEKKRILNPSKSQNDINTNFIINQLDDKKTEEPNKNLKPSEPAIKKLLRMESICKKGFAGPGVKKINQDNFFIYKNFLDSPDIIFLGVCDGHGMFGQDVSGYLVNHLPQNLNNAFLKENIKSISAQKDYEQITSVMSLTFVQTNINLVNDDKVDSTFSGTTCSSLLFCPEKIITANVGDSRCVMGKFDGKNWKALNITRDHKPNEEDEKKRIIEKGGRIEAYKDEEGDYAGPERVWLKAEDVPGLAMSRSFGDDIAHTVGVVSQPEIFEYKLLNEDKFIMLASDGIWEFISSDECVNIVKDYYLKDDIDGALNYLYKESSKRWIMEEEVIDDITLIIMFLN